MKIFSFLNRGSDEDSGLQEIYPLSLACDLFTRADIIATYAKILTDTLDRTQGVPKDLEPLFWDNCVQTASQYGLVSHLTRAMARRIDLYLVYSKATNVLREATQAEREQIQKDYQAKAESALGVYISFKHFHKTEMLLIYSALEYCVLSSLHKTVNISKAVQIKIKDLRSSVALSDAAVATAQARAIADALRSGKDVMIDSGDEITNATPDISATEKAISFLDAKRAFILGLPLSYLSGEMTPGISATGEADTRATERGLRLYFLQIIYPVVKALFGVETEFKSQDFRQMESASDLLKTFELVSDEYLSREAKQSIIARIFDLDPAEEQAALAAEAADRAANPPPVQQVQVIDATAAANAAKNAKGGAA